MAGRPQRRAAYGPNRPRVGVHPVYEDFKPDTEWKHEEKSDILLIQLPGFAKEHLKVSMEGTSTLRIRGERLVGGNKWSTFEEVVIIPEDCDRTGIRAKYEHGVLTITMPKTHKDSPVVLKQETEAKTTTTTTTTQSNADQKRKVDQQEVQSKKQKHENIHEEAGKQENARKSLSEHFAAEQDKTSVTSEHPKKQPDTINTQETTAGATTTLTSEEKDETEHKGDLDSNKKTSESVVKDGLKNETEEKELENVGEGVPATPAGIISGFRFNKYMQAMKDKLPKRTELNEERQLMVNVGTAVLVIVGLGAYISYATGLSG